jgi:putative phosphoribosyl transferase
MQGSRPVCAMFDDRKDAGTRLAHRLAAYRGEAPIVVALPRGGVPIGYEVARALGAPLEIIVVRKIGAPGQHELGIGALVDGDHPETVLNQELLRMIDVSPEYLADAIKRELKEIRRRETVYRKGHSPLDLKGRAVLVVDDGIATGGSIRAALRGVRRRGARKIVLAVPVAAAETLESLRPEVDETVCLLTPQTFGAIGEFYRDFNQTSDDEVITLLDRAREHLHSPAPSASGS